MKKIMEILILLLIIISVIPQVGSINTLNYKSQREDNINSLTYDDFDEEINRLMKKGHIPSLVLCYIKNDDIVFSNAYGLSDIQQNKETTIDTTYMVASISKTFVATSLLQLYEKGFFDLDDDVNEYLPFEVRNPNFPNNPITFRMLLAHQSSYVCKDVESMIAPFEPMIGTNTLREGFQWFLFSLIHLKDIFSGFYPEEKYPWIEDVMATDGILYHPDHWGDYPPGEGHYYSNIAFVLLGYLVELISGESFENYCMDHIFKPLSMNNTSFYIEDLDEEKLAVPYMRLHGFYIPIPNYEYHCLNPAAGLRTNIIDLSHFLIAHMNEGEYDGVRILNITTIEEMHKIQYPDGYYGLGWGWWLTEPRKQGHGGSNPGFSSNMFYRESDNVGVIYFFNEERWGGIPTPLGIYWLLTDYGTRDELWNFIWDKADDL